jgi:hypothetical protein
MANEGQIAQPMQEVEVRYLRRTNNPGIQPDLTETDLLPARVWWG